MDRIPVVKVHLYQDRQPGLSFSSIAEADGHILTNPTLKFEFRVHWQDGTSQLGRVMGKPIAVWIRDWLAMALGDPAALSGTALRAHFQLHRDPKMVAHAYLLRDRLSHSSV